MFQQGRYDQGAVTQGQAWLRFLTSNGPVYLLVDVNEMVVITAYSHKLWKQNGMYDDFEEVEYKPKPRRQNHRQKGKWHG